jgi:hypothetical protein
MRWGCGAHHKLGWSKIAKMLHTCSVTNNQIAKSRKTLSARPRQDVRKTIHHALHRRSRHHCPVPRKPFSSRPAGHCRDGRAGHCAVPRKLLSYPSAGHCHAGRAGHCAVPRKLLPYPSAGHCRAGHAGHCAVLRKLLPYPFAGHCRAGNTHPGLWIVHQLHWRPVACRPWATIAVGGNARLRAIHPRCGRQTCWSKAPLWERPSPAVPAQHQRPNELLGNAAGLRPRLSSAAQTAAASNAKSAPPKAQVHVGRLPYIPCARANGS